MAELNDSKNNDRKLEEMLDSMLSTYSSAEPRPGLETRILANLKEQSAQRTSGWSIGWIWIGGIAMAAAVILLVSYLWRPQPLPVNPQMASRPAPQEDTRQRSVRRPRHYPSSRRSILPGRVRRRSRMQANYRRSTWRKLASRSSLHHRRCPNRKSFCFVTSRARRGKSLSRRAILIRRTRLMARIQMTAGLTT